MGAAIADHIDNGLVPEAKFEMICINKQEVVRY